MSVRPSSSTIHAVARSPGRVSRAARVAAWTSCVWPARVVSKVQSSGNHGRHGMWIFLCVSMLAALFPATAGAQPVSGVAVEVVTVLASNIDEVFDPRLLTHQPYFVTFPYSSYRLLRRQTQYVPWGDRARFNLPGRGELRVWPKAREESGVTLNLALRGAGRRRLVDTSVCLQDHRVLLVGGPRHEYGVLILLIGATASVSR